MQEQLPKRRPENHDRNRRSGRGRKIRRERISAPAPRDGGEPHGRGEQPVGQYAAFEIAPELPLDLRGDRWSTPFALFGQQKIGFQVFLHQAVQGALFWTSAGIGCRSACLCGDRHVAPPYLLSL